MDKQLQIMLREHGLRGVLNCLAMILEDKAQAQHTVRYDESGGTVRPNDLRTAAANLKADMW